MGYHKVTTDTKVKPLFKKHKKRMSKFQKQFHDSIFPVSINSLWYTLALILLLHYLDIKPFFGAIHKIDHQITRFIGGSLATELAAVVLCSVLVWSVAVQIVRYSITIILMYKGWLYESAGKVSWLTKIWMLIIQYMYRKASPLFFSYQDLLPAMPVPSLKLTISTYLRSMRPLIEDEKYNELVQLSHDFLHTVGPKMQRRLYLKWLTSPNYITDWWEKFAYLRSRGSLIRTNVAGMDVIFTRYTNCQAARAATLCVLRYQWAREIHMRQTMKPITMNGIPLCARQYTHCHRRLRVPGVETDKVVALDENCKHSVVYHRGCWYKINMFSGKRLLRPAELEGAFQSILDRSPDPQPGESHLSSLTCGERATWAVAREKYFSNGINRESLRAIEHGINVIFLDEHEGYYDENNPSALDNWYARALHGDGYKLWCDRPTTMTFFKNGTMCCNGEHSVADALVYCHIVEYFKYHENFGIGYTEDGHAKGNVEITPAAERLKWDLSDECQQIIQQSYKKAKEVADDLDNAAFVFKEYGKEFIKTLKVSPDAFIQQALQLSYYRDLGRHGQTYESALARLYRDGRTETVRSCTIESSAFVRAMCDPETTKDERLSLLRAACDQHQSLYRDAMAGKAPDRHLFGLYIVSKYLNVDAPFLDRVFEYPWMMSTSQTPQHQQADYMKVLNASSHLFWPSGAFCAPTGSNYGVCYTVASDGSKVGFHISSWKSIPVTNSIRFRDVLQRSLREMYDLA